MVYHSEFKIRGVKLFFFLCIGLTAKILQNVLNKKKKLQVKHHVIYGMTLS